MSDISALIDVYRMVELKPETRARLIIKLGRAINNSMGMNITQDIVYELVEILDKDHPIFKTEEYLFHMKHKHN